MNVTYYELMLRNAWQLASQILRLPSKEQVKIKKQQQRSEGRSNNVRPSVAKNIHTTNRIQGIQAYGCKDDEVKGRHFEMNGSTWVRSGILQTRRGLDEANVLGIAASLATTWSLELTGVNFQAENSIPKIIDN